MRKINNLPRILKINSIHGHKVSVVFNNGESRTINFKKVFDEIALNEKSPAWILLDPNELAKAEIKNNTLSWSNVDQSIVRKNGLKLKVPFEIGADVLYRLSEPEKSELKHRVGKLIREARKKSGLTQEELAQKSGTSRNYISRIENERSDIELSTLYKIIEIGLGRKFRISIK